MTVRGRKGKFETITVEPKEEVMHNRYRIVETKDQEGRRWYHAEEGYDVENWHIVHDIKKCDDPLLVEERLRNYSHHRIVKELTL